MPPNAWSLFLTFDLTIMHALLTVSMPSTLLVILIVPHYLSATFLHQPGHSLLFHAFLGTD